MHLIIIIIVIHLLRQLAAFDTEIAQCIKRIDT